MTVPSMSSACGRIHSGMSWDTAINDDGPVLIRELDHDLLQHVR